MLLAKLTDTDNSAYFTEVRAELATMFNKYDSKFGAVRLQRPAQQPSSGKKKTAWSQIFASDGPGATSSSVGIGTGNTSTSSFLARRASASALLHAASTTAGLGIASELSSYLDTDTVPQYDDDDFNILTWWHEHKLTYPVLSILARDVLTVPVSTIS